MRVVLAMKFDKGKVQTNSCDLGREFFGFLEEFERLIPVFAAHGNDAKVGEGRAGVRIGGEHLMKGFFSSIEVAELERGLALLEPSLSVSNACRLFGLGAEERFSRGRVRGMTQEAQQVRREWEMRGS